MAQHEATENGVVNYAGLHGMVLEVDDAGNHEVWLGIPLKSVLAVDGFERVVEKVTERIENGTGRDFSTQLKKQVNRVALHRAHLQDALTQLVGLYEKIITPKLAKSAVWRARYSMLEGMNPKILKLYAVEHLPEEVDNYILTDPVDRVNLITKLTNILAEEKEVVTAE